MGLVPLDQMSSRRLQEAIELDQKKRMMDPFYDEHMPYNFDENVLQLNPTPLMRMIKM